MNKKMREKEKRELERKLKSLYKLQESTRCVMERYRLFYESLHGEALEIEEKLKKMEVTV